MPKIRFLLLLIFCSILFATAIERHCPLCGMKFADRSKISFKIAHKGEMQYFCSFICTSRMMKKFPEAAIYTVDFNKNEWIDARRAFFLIKSKAILREVEFGMPPSVVGFLTEEAAKAKWQALKNDGKIVFSWEGLVKAYE